jgi:ribosomal protein S18 acetylase RimI-like enzyme
MNALIKEGKERCLTSAGISVTMGNEPAEKLYLSIGFKPYITYFEEYFSGYFPGTAKYRLTLISEDSGWQSAPADINDAGKWSN